MAQASQNLINCRWVADSVFNLNSIRSQSWVTRKFFKELLFTSFKEALSSFFSSCEFSPLIASHFANFASLVNESSEERPVKISPQRLSSIRPSLTYHLIHFLSWWEKEESLSKDFLSSRNGSSLKGELQLLISVVGTLAVLEHAILVVEVLDW